MITYLLPYCKGLLRIKSSSFDIEVSTLIMAALADLNAVGVDTEKKADDSLLRVAVGTYVKGMFGIENKDSEKYMSAYEIMKTQMCVYGEYHVE